MAAVRNSASFLTPPHPRPSLWTWSCPDWTDTSEGLHLQVTPPTDFLCPETVGGRRCICRSRQHSSLTCTAILFWSLCLSKVGCLLRISQSVLKVEHIFELQNLYSLRFTESEICLPLCEFETQPEHNKFVYIDHFWVFCLLSTKSWVECSKFLYSLGLSFLLFVLRHQIGDAYSVAL